MPLTPARSAAAARGKTTSAARSRLWDVDRNGWTDRSSQRMPQLLSSARMEPATHLPREDDVLRHSHQRTGALHAMIGKAAANGALEGTVGGGSMVRAV